MMEFAVNQMGVSGGERYLPLTMMDWGFLATLTLPMLVLLGAAVVILLVSAFSKKALGTAEALLAGVALLAAIFLSWKSWVAGPALGVGMLLFDRMSYSLDLVFLVTAALTVLVSKDYLPQENIRQGEYYSLLLFATLGAMIIAHAGDLILLFLGLEIISLSAYVLAGMKKGVIRSYEAALKYFVLGSFASGFLLYGIALMYGAAGSTSLASLQQMTLPPAEPILVFLSIALLMIGIGFKIAAVPFHLWSPDVYEGSPTAVTAFMASTIKAAGFAALLRLVLSVGHIPQIPWTSLLTVLSVLTMTVGNLAALRQTNIKRMLAYSSIAHTGYALAGVAAALQENVLAESTLGAVIFYLFAYSLMTMGAFAVVIAMGRRGESADELSDFSGLSKKHPLLAASLTVFLLSLTGIPPAIGFVGKFYLFSGAVEAGLYGLVIAGVLNSALSAYYYLGPIVKMYFQEEQGCELPPLSYTLVVGIFLCLFVVVYLGLFPSGLFLIARESVRELVF